MATKITPTRDRSAQTAADAGADRRAAAVGVSAEPSAADLRRQYREEKSILDLTMLRFYKRFFGPVLGVLALSIAGNTIQGVASYLSQKQEVRREYFAYDAKTGVMVPMKPLDKPVLTDAELLNFAVKCVSAINTFDFVNHRKQLQEARYCFTDDGWDKYQAAVERAGSVQAVITARMVSSAASSQAPVITRRGKLKDGTLAIEVEAPTVITYSGGQTANNVSQQILVKLMLVRIPAYEGQAGVAIAQYIGEER